MGTTPGDVVAAEFSAGTNQLQEMKTNVIESKAAIVLRWSARVVATLLFLLWSAFFVEHTIEWFIQPLPQTPPAGVWLGHAQHFLILAGLVMLWRWEVIGSLVLIGSSLVFFVDKAGANFPLFFGVTAIPAVLLLVGRWLARRIRPAAR